MYTLIKDQYGLFSILSPDVAIMEGDSIVGEFPTLESAWVVRREMERK